MTSDARLDNPAVTAEPRRTVARRLRTLLARISLGVATVILSLNLWTGFPLLALWFGSQATGGQILNMTGVVVTLIALVTLCWLGVVLLARISAGYDRVTGRPPPVRQPPPWLLSMSSSSVQPARRGRRELNAVEMIVISAVVAAFVLFEIWFFFLASSRI